MVELGKRAQKLTRKKLHTSEKLLRNWTCGLLTFHFPGTRGTEWTASQICQNQLRNKTCGPRLFRESTTEWEYRRTRAVSHTNRPLGSLRLGSTSGFGLGLCLGHGSTCSKPNGKNLVDKRNYTTMTYQEPQVGLPFETLWARIPYRPVRVCATCN